MVFVRSYTRIIPYCQKSKHFPHLFPLTSYHFFSMLPVIKKSEFPVFQPTAALINKTVLRRISIESWSCFMKPKSSAIAIYS